MRQAERSSSLASSEPDSCALNRLSSQLLGASVLPEHSSALRPHLGAQNVTGQASEVMRAAEDSVMPPSFTRPELTDIC